MYKLYINKIKDDSIGDYILIKNKKIKSGLIECFFEIFENYLLIASVEGVYCYYNYLEKSVINLEGNLNSRNLDLDFSGIFSVLMSVEEYDKIRNLSNYKKILKKINDISYLNIFAREDLTFFKDSDFFIEEFLESKDRLKAYGNGFNGFNKVSKLENIYVEINNGAKIFFKSENKNDSIFPKSIYSIVGKNGLGKSLALKEIYIKYKNNFNKIQVFSSGLISQSYYQGVAKNDDSYINVSKNSNFNYLISELLIFRNENLSSMLFFLLADIFSDKRYHNVFINKIPLYEKITVRDFFEKLGKGNFFNEQEFSKINLSRFINGKSYNLSSGEKSIINIVFNMVLTTLKSNGENLFIFDEPENHLHPNFISQLMNLINKILYHSNSYAVIATHSPFVIKNLLKENIIVLKQKNDQVVAEKITFNTLGANVETISQFVFGNSDLMELESEILNEIIETYPRDQVYDNDLIIEKLSNHLSPELILEFITKLKG